MSWPWDWFNLTHKHLAVHKKNLSTSKKPSLVSSDSEHFRSTANSNSPVSPAAVDDAYLQSCITKDTPHVVRYVHALGMLSRYSNSPSHNVPVAMVLLNLGVLTCSDSEITHPLQKILCPDVLQKYSFFTENESIYDLIMRQIFTLCSDRYENESSYRVKLRLNAFLQVLGCGLKGSFIQGNMVQSCLQTWVAQLQDYISMRKITNFPFDLHRLDFLANAPFDRYGIAMSISMRGKYERPDSIKALESLIALYGNVDDLPLYVVRGTENFSKHQRVLVH